MKCFVKSQTGQDLQSILFDKIGKAILDFGNVIGKIKSKINGVEIALFFKIKILTKVAFRS